MKVKIFFLICFCSIAVRAEQTLTREFNVRERPRILIENRTGKVRVKALENQSTEAQPKIRFEAANQSNTIISEEDLTIVSGKESFEIRINSVQKPINLTVFAPVRAKLEIVGGDGEIVIEGNFAEAKVSTETGTIYADVPIDALRYNFLWTESRPKFLSDVALAEIKEKAGGKFVIDGKIGESRSPKSKVQSQESAKEIQNEEIASAQKPKIKDQLISLEFTTRRGIVLLNVPPSEVPSDLTERPLTEAAKAIVRGSDSILAEAIRRANPKRFGEYASTLPPHRAAPSLTIARTTDDKALDNVVRRVNVSVIDADGHAVDDLQSNDFSVFESNAEREVTNVELAAAPFNLVLLLDVSGSVDERLDFIRKAARNFLATVDQKDKLAIVTFRDDAQILKNFTTDKQDLSAALDSFEAGGGTALYDALAYTLVDVLRRLRGERTAIVILSDGDDNRSFLSFAPLLGAVQESGAIVYPLYLPSGLTLQNSTVNSNQTSDPLRTRYLTLTTKAESEARELAKASGGQYFPIQNFADLQRAYNEIVKQLRTAYTLTYRSAANSRVRPRVQVKRPKVFVQTTSAIDVSRAEAQDK